MSHRTFKTLLAALAVSVAVVLAMGAVINGHSGSASDPSTPWRTATHGDTLTGDASFSVIRINTGATGGTVTISCDDVGGTSRTVWTNTVPANSAFGAEAGPKSRCVDMTFTGPTGVLFTVWR